MISREEFAKNLETAKARNLPRLTWERVLNIEWKEGQAPDDAFRANMARVDDYLRAFVDLRNDGDEPTCLGCGRAFVEALKAILLPSDHVTRWEWSLAHGEVHCVTCGWPGRAYHYDVGKTDTEDAVIPSLRVVLAVHPDEIILRPEASKG